MHTLKVISLATRVNLIMRLRFPAIDGHTRQAHATEKLTSIWHYHLPAHFNSGRWEQWPHTIHYYTLYSNISNTLDIIGNNYL